ncbi:hypothetical protein J7L05_01280 [bacterium]|nr:hypothetical protein [bacterium]
MKTESTKAIGALRTLATIVFSLALITLVAGCAASGAAYPKSPEAVVVAMMKASAEGNMKDVQNYCCKDMRDGMGAFNKYQSMMGQESPQADQDFDESEALGRLQSTISGKNADVFFKEMPYMKFLMVNESGKWKFSGIDFDQEEMMKSMADMTGDS